MLAATIEYQIEQGSTFKRVYRLDDENGNPIDLTNITFAGQVRWKAEDATKLFDIVITKQNQITNRGEIEVCIPHAATSGMVLDSNFKNQKGKYVMVFDIEIIYSVDDVQKIFKGRIFMTPEVTKQ
jgi:hypothetical protein